MQKNLIPVPYYYRIVVSNDEWKTNLFPEKLQLKLSKL